MDIFFAGYVDLGPARSTTGREKATHRERRQAMIDGLREATI